MSVLTDRIRARATTGGSAGYVPFGPPPQTEPTIDLQRRRAQLAARLADLQLDLGGLAYEMAVRGQVRADLLARRAAIMQSVDAELREIDRIIRTEQTGVSGSCPTCRAPHSAGAVYCWQCGNALLAQMATTSVVATDQPNRPET